MTSPTRSLSAQGHDSVTESRSVLGTEGAIAMVLFKNGERVAAIVVEPLHPFLSRLRFALRPIGCRKTLTFEIAEVRRAYVLRGLTWSESHAIATAQRERFDQTEQTR